jgi:integrase
MALEWRHLDLRQRLWRIPAELLKSGHDYEAPVPRFAAEELTRFRNTVAESCSKNGTPLSDQLARNCRIFGLDLISSVRRSFQAAVRRAEFDGLTLHDLRRCYVNKLRQSGVGVDIAMRVSDHRDINTFMKHYREIGRAELANAVRALEVKPSPAEGEETPGVAGQAGE